MQRHHGRQPQKQRQRNRNRPTVRNGTLAEWLKRRPAKPMGSPRVGWNPACVALPTANAIANAIPKCKCHLHGPNRRQRTTTDKTMTPVGFEPTQLALVELGPTPLDHSGKLSCGVKRRAHHWPLPPSLAVPVHEVWTRWGLNPGPPAC